MNEKNLDSELVFGKNSTNSKPELTSARVLFQLILLKNLPKRYRWTIGDGNRRMRITPNAKGIECIRCISHSADPEFGDCCNRRLPSVRYRLGTCPKRFLIANPALPDKRISVSYLFSITGQNDHFLLYLRVNTVGLKTQIFIFAVFSSKVLPFFSHFVYFFCMTGQYTTIGLNVSQRKPV